VRSDEPFEQLVHPVPSYTIEPIGIEFDFRRSKQILATKLPLALSKALDHSMYQRQERRIVDRLDRDCRKKMGLEWPRTLCG
jgi:hypothetical protein